MTTEIDASCEAPAVALAQAEEAEYCAYVRRSRHNEFWWYFNGLAPYRGFSRPFPDRDGRWWYCVKPGFAWPVDFFDPLPDSARPGRRSLLGWQFPVAPARANSHVHLNVIQDLSGYTLEGIPGKKRRWTIRKSLREHVYATADPSDAAIAEEARTVWNSHVERTGWNKTMSASGFQASWGELAGCPGTTLLTARQRGEAAAVCAWLICRVIGRTAFIDTLASHSDRLGGAPNDGLVFTYLESASKLGAGHAHYALKSSIASLEAFKQALGFTPLAFPTRLQLRPGVATALRLVRPAAYRRLRGEPEPPGESAALSPDASLGARPDQPSS
jgi:hypothetical protein